MQQRQQGFGLVTWIIATLIVLALVGGAVYTMWSQTPKTEQSPTGEYLSTPLPDKGRIVPPENEDASKFLYLHEWDVEGQLGSTNPAQIEYRMGGKTSDTKGPIEAQAHLYIKASALPNDACRDLGISVNRRTAAHRVGNGNRVGNFAYDITVIPTSCTDEAAQKVRQPYLDSYPTWSFYSSN